jgi:Tfp pilus assembly protein PilF
MQRWIGMALGLAAASAAWSQEPVPATPAPPPAAAPASAPTGPRSITDMTLPEQLQTAQRLRERGDRNSARQVVDYILARDPKNLDARNLGGELFLDELNIAGARKEFAAALEMRANDFRANFGMGKAFHSGRYWRQALHYLKVAETTAPNDKLADVLVFLAEAYRGAGQGADALNTIKRAIAASPNNFAARLFLTSLMQERGEYIEGLAESERLVTLAQNELRDSTSKYESLARIDAAFDSRLKIVEAAERELHTRNPNGSYSDQLLPGKEAAAAEMMSLWVDTFVLKQEVSTTLSYFRAIEIMRQALIYQPQDVKLYLKMCGLLRNTYQNDRAIEGYRRVLEIDPGNADALAGLAELGASVTAPASAPSTAPSEPEIIIPAASQPAAKP